MLSKAQISRHDLPCDLVYHNDSVQHQSHCSTPAWIPCQHSTAKCSRSTSELGRGHQEACTATELMTKDAITQLNNKAVGVHQYTYKKPDGNGTIHSWCCSLDQIGLLHGQSFHPRKGSSKVANIIFCFKKVATTELL